MSYLTYIKRIFYRIKNGSPNSLRYQTKWSSRFINSQNEDYSNEWGYVDKVNPGLGDYIKISKEITEYGNNFNEGICLDLGCLDGKWSVILAKSFSKVCLVDLTDLLVNILSSKLGTKMGTFYKTKGDELLGFENEAIDFIFSMDSLVRAPRESIFNYFSEFHRVLKYNGIIYIHLPVIEKPSCITRGFTNLTIGEIEIKLNQIGFSSIELDMDTLVHGVIVHATKI
jgi:SAM-dependent methyltransferase